MYRFLFSRSIDVAIHFPCISTGKKKDVTAPETPKEIKLEKKLQNKIYSFPQFWHETVLFIKQPGKWGGNDWLKFGGVVVATIAVMPFDEGITNSTQGDQKYYNSAAVEGGRIYGNGIPSHRCRWCRHIRTASFTIPQPKKSPLNCCRQVFIPNSLPPY
jgi:hypothetical protein